MKKQIYIIAIVLLFIIGCTDSNKNSVTDFNNDKIISNNPQPVAGSYNYSGYDLDGNLIATGIISITLADSIITGTRDLSGSGYENGKGDISGYLTNKEITITLTPNSLGHIILKGQLNNGTFSGIRYLDTGASPVNRNEGTFTAVILSN